jgi:uncharacterized protein YcbK (DUF882 family)
LSFTQLKIDLDKKIDGSRYFLWKEALWLPQMRAYALPTTRQRRLIIQQAHALDGVREYFNSPILVHNWLRPPAYNELVGGAPLSRHRLGDATDFHIVGYSCEEVRKELMAHPDIYPGRGEINSTNWIHLDLKNRRWFEV